MSATRQDLCLEVDLRRRSPFSLDNEDEYQSWRRRKLALVGELDPRRIFPLDAANSFPEDCWADVLRQVEAFNFVLFEAERTLDKADFLRLNRQLGLNRLDANPAADADRVTSLEAVGDSDERARFIPYTNRALKWHTDGYYNPGSLPIRAFALYCVRQASRGGGNYLFDHELMYLKIRDSAPESLGALMAADMMCIPADVVDSRLLRAEETGPVFAVAADGQGLEMRYTSRPQNIVWKADPGSVSALDQLRRILMNDQAAIEIRLRAGQGLICNNLLHGRQAFVDDPGGQPRLLYRARYQQPMARQLAPA